MMHLSHDELRQWRDAPSPDRRARIVDHLAECDDCCAAYAELVRSRPVEGPPQLEAAQFVERGYRVRRTGSTRLLEASWLRPVSLAAASIFVAVALFWTMGRDGEVVYRGGAGSIVLVGPADNATSDGAPTFEWRGAESASCRLRVFDPARPEAPVIDRQAQSGAPLTQDERAQLAPGVTYRWFVECPTDGGTVTSPSSRFTVRRN